MEQFLWMVLGAALFCVADFAYRAWDNWAWHQKYRDVTIKIDHESIARQVNEASQRLAKE